MQELLRFSYSDIQDTQTEITHSPTQKAASNKSGYPLVSRAKFPLCNVPAACKLKDLTFLKHSCFKEIPQWLFYILKCIGLFPLIDTPPSTV